MPSALVVQIVEAALVRLLRGDLVNAEPELPNHHQTGCLMNLLSEAVPVLSDVAPDDELS